MRKWLQDGGDIGDADVVLVVEEKTTKKPSPLTVPMSEGETEVLTVFDLPSPPKSCLPLKKKRAEVDDSDLALKKKTRAEVDDSDDDIFNQIQQLPVANPLSSAIATNIASHSSHSSTSHNLYPPNSEWDCALCTFVNCGESPTCDVCGKERPSRSAALK